MGNPETLRRILMVDHYAASFRTGSRQKRAKQRHLAFRVEIKLSYVVANDGYCKEYAWPRFIFHYQKFTVNKTHALITQELAQH